MPKALAPYAAGAALVLVASLVVLGVALGSGGLLEERRAAPSSPSPTAARAPVELSPNGRIAYWRTEANGDHQLWVANADGTQRRGIEKIDDLRRVSFMRWSPTGDALAYIDGGLVVVVRRLDGTRTELAMPVAIQTSGARFVDLGWSTDGRSLAATAFGGGTSTDVYVASADGGAWRNATNVRGALLGQWISADELLVQTVGGLVAVQSADGAHLRPLTALPATSPFIADDGRVHFLSGQIAPAIRDPRAPSLNASNARVWSATVDGGDVRQETTQPYDDVRLAGRWPDGRYLAHPGTSADLRFLTGPVPAPITTFGVVDRFVFAPDRRTAIGLTSSRILRYDTARLGEPTVLLDGVAQPDAWSPSTVAVARASPTPQGAAPAARYTFTLGGLLWATDARGESRVLARSQLPEARPFLSPPPPQWSPAGDRILWVDALPPAYDLVYVADPRGDGPRLVSGQGDTAGPSPVWTPDGNVAYVTLVGTRDANELRAPGEIHVVSPAGVELARYPGREIAIAAGRTFVVENDAASVVELGAEGSRRTIVTAPALGAAAGFPPNTPLAVSAALASADGAYLALRLGQPGATVVRQGQPPVPPLLAIVRAGDGTASLFLPGMATSDVRWSPAGHLLGLTMGDVAFVRDAASPATIVAAQPAARFAGWSPDGAWYYVARAEGLYAYRLTGGDPVRVAPFGVPVSAARP